jgi:hypothetical protein
MPRFTARSALIAALAVVALGGTAAIATAAVTGQFGYHKVRDGLR